MSHSINPDRLPALLARYPELFAPDLPSRAFVPPGWAARMDRLCADLEALGAGVRLVDVDEKHGTLRVLARTPPSSDEDMARRVAELVDRAERDCERICRECGAPSELHRSVPGWWNTLCAACEAQREALEGHPRRRVEVRGEDHD